LSNLKRTVSLLLVFACAAFVGFAQEKQQPKRKKKKEEPEVIASIIRKLPAEYDAASWKTFESAQGGFSILFPGTPEEETQKLLVGAREVPLRLFRFDALANYAVMCLDMPAEQTVNAEATRKLLEASTRQAFQQFQARPLERKEITIDGHPGLSAKLRLPEGLVMRLRVYAVRGRLYQLMITTPPEQGATADQRRFYEATASKFLDSFTLTPAAAPAQSEAAESARLEALAGGAVRGSSGGAPEKLPRAPVSGGVIDGKTISKPAPVYPEAAKQAGVSGKVEVFVVVDEEGRVIKAEAVRGPVQLRGAAVEAARQARFSPVRLSGEPVKYSGLLNYNFVLR
jgi:TonB family protein